MNTDIELSAVAPEAARLARTVEESFRYFEQLLSRFRPDSELSQLNGCQETFFSASHDFFAAVEAALWAAQQTGGIYDPAILPYLEEAGYGRTFAAVANSKPWLGDQNEAIDSYSSRKGTASDRIRAGYDYRHFGLDTFTRTIQRPTGLRIDLGGMGKGWTADRVADELCEQGHFLLNAGGDLYAYGAPGAGQGWQVHLTHPVFRDLNYATLVLEHHAVATSTIVKRRWMKDGIVQHHLIDPRNGRPAITDAISVSVVAGRVFTAEIYAKTALILGIDEGLAFLESLPDVEGVLFSATNETFLTSELERYLEKMDPAGY
jgi:thiamine biosynthesis lipoprotein